VLLGACVTSLSFAAFSQHLSFDQYWHLKTGLDAITSGLDPRVDQYSYTFGGTPTPQQPLAFQYMFGAFGSVLGLDEAIIAIRGVSITLYLIALGLFLRQCKPPAIVWGICLVASCFFLEQRLLARPELFDYVLIALGFCLYARLWKGLNHYDLMLVTCFTLAWVNYHAGILAYTIFIGVFLDHIPRKAHDDYAQKVLQWAGWGAFAVIVGFLNSSFQHPLIGVLQFSEVWNAIEEHKPVPTGEIFRATPFLPALWISGGILALWAIRIGRFGLLTVILVFLWASVERSRMVSITGMVMTLCFALLASDSLSRKIFSDLKDSVKTLLTVSAIALLIILTANLTYSSNQNSEFNHPNIDDTIAYIERSNRSGRLLNNHNWGGYLIYKTSPEQKVFIDGRTNVLYPEDFFKIYMAVDAGDPNAAKLIRQKFEFDSVFWSYSKTLHPITAGSLGVTAEYIGDQSILYSPVGVLQQLADVLIFPMCVGQLTPDFLSTAVKELALQSPRNDSLLALVTLIEANQGTPVQSVDVVNAIDKDWTDKELALLAHWLMSRQNYSGALIAWNALSSRQPLDRIYAAYSAIQASNLLMARSYLVGLMFEAQQSVVEVTDSQVRQIYTLYTALEAQGGFNKPSLDIAHSFLTERLPGHKGSPAEQPTTFVINDFCFKVTHSESI